MRTPTHPSPHARIRAGFGLALAWLAAVGPASATLTFEEGLARDPKDNSLLYREQHLMRKQDGRLTDRLVLYRCPDGTAFARKQLDYRGAAMAPAFRLEDARTGYAEGLERSGAGETVFVREGPGAAEQQAPLEAASAPRVVDAGFDEFVRANWNALLSGETVPLEFAVPSRLEGIRFKVYRVQSDEVGAEPAEVFRLRLGGLLGWIAPHIDVAYGRDTQRLLRFEGLSNLREDDGEGQLVARIEFPAKAVAAQEAQWQAFAAEPLSACRVRG
jgi:hypothetical protein